jgi:hypothetical protein
VSAPPATPPCWLAAHGFVWRVAKPAIRPAHCVQLLLHNQPPDLQQHASEHPLPPHRPPAAVYWVVSGCTPTHPEPPSGLDGSQPLGGPGPTTPATGMLLHRVGLPWHTPGASQGGYCGGLVKRVRLTNSATLTMLTLLLPLLLRRCCCSVDQTCLSAGCGKQARGQLSLELGVTQPGQTQVAGTPRTHTSQPEPESGVQCRFSVLRHCVYHVYTPE